MDHKPSDSSGSDDDLPFLPRKRISIGESSSGQGRTPPMAPDPYPIMYDDTTMEGTIHQLEIEAYNCVLRAFRAKSDAITWEREGLITDLRKELRLSNDEHSIILKSATADETVQNIRSWRESVELQPATSTASQLVHDQIPSTSDSASHIKQKIDHPFQPFAGPFPPIHPEAISIANHPSSSAAMHGPLVRANRAMPPGASSLNTQYLSGPIGRGQSGSRISSGGRVNEPAPGTSNVLLVGRKVRTRCPRDNNFYEALITNYNAHEGRHALAYDLGSGNEALEWVNLSEISPENIQWLSNDAGSLYQYHGGSSGPVRAMNRARGRPRGRGLPHRRQSRKGLPPLPPFRTPQQVIGPDAIQIRDTNSVIREVERVFCDSNSTGAEKEEAEKILREHEQSLQDAISKIDELNDRDDRGEGRDGQANQGNDGV